MSDQAQSTVKWRAENIGILAYGSLHNDPGPELRPHIIDRIPQKTPWPVEYARSSESRGGGPTLVIHPWGSPVEGAVLVLDIKRSDIEVARELLRRREGTSKKHIDTTEAAGLEVVLYANLPANISDTDLVPEHLAELAIKSVAVKPDRNGIRYLAENIKSGIATPLTEAYRLAILARLEANDLDMAERIAKIRAKNRGRWLSWRKIVWLTLAILVFWFSSSGIFRSTGSIHVRVTTHSTKAKPTKDEPIGDAELELISEEDESPPVFKESNGQGLVDFGNVSPGEYKVKVRATDFVGKEEQFVVHAGDQILEERLVSLADAPSYYGSWKDRRGREHTREELERILREHARWANQVLGISQTPCGEFAAGIERVERGGREKGSPADLAGAQLFVESGDFRITTGSDLSGRDLRGANLKGTKMLNADLACTNLDKADLRGADVEGAELTGASLGETDMQGADLSRASVGMTLFEPKSLPVVRGMANARNLQSLTYRTNPDSIFALRKKFADNGYREQERGVIYALRRSQAEIQLQTARSQFENCSPRYSALGREKGIPIPIEVPQFSILRPFGAQCELLNMIGNYGAYWLKTILFDWTCQYGKSPSRPLRLLVAWWLAFALVYPFFMDRRLAHSANRLPSGIYLVRKRNWQEHSALQQIRFAASPIRSQKGMRFLIKLTRRELRLFGVSLCFSLLSSFNIGFREASVGVWLRMLTRREYELKAVGWARAIAGVQSLAGVYLFAVWMLTTFGTPFA